MTKIEECGSEENAFENLPIDEIAQDILNEAKIKNSIKQSTLIITLVILGSPLWLSLLAAVLLTVSISIWTIVIALIVSSILTLITLFTIMSVNPATAWALFGLGLIAQGIGILLFKPAIHISIWFYKAYIFIWKNLIEGFVALVKAIKNRGTK